MVGTGQFWKTESLTRESDANLGSVTIELNYTPPSGLVDREVEQT